MFQKIVKEDIGNEETTLETLQIAQDILIDWVNFHPVLALYQLCEMLMIWRWDRLITTPTPGAQVRL